MMVRLANPQEGQSLYDPCRRSGVVMNEKRIRARLLENGASLHKRSV
jgi:hypothetical protein